MALVVPAPALAQEEDVTEGLFVAGGHPLAFEIGVLRDLGDGGEDAQMKVALVATAGNDEDGPDLRRSVREAYTLAASGNQQVELVGATDDNVGDGKEGAEDGAGVFLAFDESVA